MYQVYCLRYRSSIAARILHSVCPSESLVAIPRHLTVRILKRHPRHIRRAVVHYARTRTLQIRHQCRHRRIRRRLVPAALMVYRPQRTRYRRALIVLHRHRHTVAYHLTAVVVRHVQPHLVRLVARSAWYPQRCLIRRSTNRDRVGAGHLQAATPIVRVVCRGRRRHRSSQVHTNHIRAHRASQRRYRCTRLLTHSNRFPLCRSALPVFSKRHGYNLLAMRRPFSRDSVSTLSAQYCSVRSDSPSVCVPRSRSRLSDGQHIVGFRRTDTDVVLAADNRRYSVLHHHVRI